MTNTAKRLRELSDAMMGLDLDMKLPPDSIDPSDAADELDRLYQVTRDVPILRAECATHRERAMRLHKLIFEYMDRSPEEVKAALQDSGEIHQACHYMIGGPAAAAFLKEFDELRANMEVAKKLLATKRALFRERIAGMIAATQMENMPPEEAADWIIEAIVVEIETDSGEAI